MKILVELDVVLSGNKYWDAQRRSVEPRLQSFIEHALEDWYAHDFDGHRGTMIVRDLKMEVTKQ